VLSRLVLPESWPTRVLALADRTFAAAFAASAMWAVGYAYQKLRHREGLGFGDVKMVMMIAMFLGLIATLQVLIVGSLAGSIIGILFVVIARKDMSSYELPFGTFLGAAAILVAYLERPIAAWSGW
jgi:leader peptidase (prepilin peptidase)/N-methyltransferase